MKRDVIALVLTLVALSLSFRYLPEFFAWAWQVWEFGY